MPRELFDPVVTERDAAGKRGESVYCGWCKDSYPVDDPALKVRHKYQFCLTNQGYRKPGKAKRRGKERTCTKTNMTDTEMLDWMEREGHESVIRLDQRGWLNMWTRTKLYATMRESILAGKVASDVDRMRRQAEADARRARESVNRAKQE